MDNNIKFKLRKSIINELFTSLDGETVLVHASDDIVNYLPSYWEKH